MNKSNLFIIILLQLIFCVAANSQTGDIVPSLKINCPTESVEAGKKIRLSATMKPDGDANTVFNWTVNNGSITNGQGTKEIQIQPFENADSITATVEINLSFAFQTIRDDCTFQIFKRPIPVKVDEFIYSAQGELKARLDYFYNELMKDPAAQGFIVLYPPSPRSQAQVERVIKDSIKWRKFDPSRITIVIGERRDIRPILHFWIVPAGAEFKPDLAGMPEPEPLYSVGANPSACELNGLYRDNLRQELANNPAATLEVRYLDGKGESAAVNAKRFQLVKQFLEKQFSVPIAFIRAGTAAGNSETQIFVKKPGAKDEYYLQIYAIKNKSICFACCEAADKPKNLLVNKKRK